MTLQHSGAKSEKPACLYISRFAPERSPSDPYFGLPRFLSAHCRFSGIWAASRRAIPFAGYCERIVNIDPALPLLPRTALRALKACAAAKPDFIICAVDEMSLSLGWLLSRWSGRPYWVVVETPPFTTRYGGDPPLWRRAERAVRKWVLRRLIARSRGLFCFADRSAVDEFLAGGARLIPLKIGISDEAYDRVREAAPKAIREEKTGGFTIGFVGAIEPEQGIPELLRAVSISQRSIGDARLLLVGEVDKDWRTEFIEMLDELGLSGKVEVTGWLPYDDMLKRVAECDVCCYTRRPSLCSQSAHPLKISEYLGSARSIIAWDYPGCHTVLEGGRFGMLAPPGNVEVFAKMLVRLVKPEARAALESEIRNNLGELLTKNSYQRVLTECVGG